MNQRTRKFIGTILMIVLVILYAVLAMLFAVSVLPEKSPLIHVAYFLVTGLFWVVPAALLIRWMQRP